MKKPYYQTIITDKSWKLLQQLKKEVKFTLIGGWAVYLYTKGLKSKDIDIIIDFSQLERLRKKEDIYKNERLKKYEIKKDGIDIDIYLPFYSKIGLPLELIKTETINRETFILPKKEILLLTKLTAYEARKATVKGQKDKIDIISLVLLPDFDFNLYKKYAVKYQLIGFIKKLGEIFTNTIEVKELGYNRHYFAQKKKIILNQLH